MRISLSLNSCPYTILSTNLSDEPKLFSSSADWISPNPDAEKLNYRTNPPAADARKVILTDTDHLWGIGGNVA